MAETLAIVLAAGKSRRMMSDTPKVLHEACGRPMVEYVLDAARTAGTTRIVVVVGHQAERVKSALAHHPDVSFALQEQQNGTGHAVMCCREAAGDHVGPILVLTGDTPLLLGSSLQKLVDEMVSQNAACVVGTAQTENNEGLGRIVRNELGEFLRIVEHRDASPEELAITEINTGCFAFDGQALFAALDRVDSNNSQGEFYLTDCAEILRNMGRNVIAADCLTIEEAMGVNTQEQLAEVERVMHARSTSC